MLASFLILELIMAIVGLVLNLPGDDFVPPTIVTHLPESFAYLGYVILTPAIVLSKFY